MRELALFAGAGGGILGGKLLGWRTVCAVELDPFARRALLARQRDGILNPFPIWDDVRTFDGRPWRGAVDVISGGFPCQDVSPGGKRAGLAGSRSGLWTEFARIIREVRPASVFIENSALLVGNGLPQILEELAEMGFHAGWGVIDSTCIGAPHVRARCWVVANSDGLNGDAEYVGGVSWLKASPWPRSDEKCVALPIRIGKKSESIGSRMADGVAYRVDRFKAIGNGQIPAVAATAWSVLQKGLKVMHD